MLRMEQTQQWSKQRDMLVFMSQPLIVSLSVHAEVLRDVQSILSFNVPQLCAVNLSTCQYMLRSCCMCIAQMQFLNRMLSAHITQRDCARMGTAVTTSTNVHGLPDYFVLCDHLDITLLHGYPTSILLAMRKSCIMVLQLPHAAVTGRTPLTH